MMQKKIREYVKREHSAYVSWLKGTHELLWCDKSRPTYRLERSYVLEKEKDKKWKRIDGLSCSKPIKFQSARVNQDVVVEPEEPKTERPHFLWTEMLSTLKGLESYTRGRIGSRDANFVQILFTDSHSLVDKVGEELTAKHLDNLKAVEIVHDKFDTDGGKEMMIYFMAD